MAVRIRLKRLGRKNRAFFRICAFDSRTRRDGRPIEELGHYDPLEANEQKKYSLNRERLSYWLSKGATPSRTMESIMLNQGIEIPGSKKKRSLSPEERQAKEELRAKKQIKRELALERKAVLSATQQEPMSRKEKREAKRAGG